MQPYHSRKGNSGVVAFELGDTFINLEFRDGSRYRYDHQKPGPEKVATMKRLALAGAGLTTFVNQHIRECFAAKLPPASPTRTKPQTSRLRDLLT